MSGGFDIDFEREILAGCVKDHDYRRLVSRATRSDDPWSTEAHRELWGLIDKLGPGDRLTGTIIASRVRVIDEDAADDLVAAGRLVLTSAPKAKHYAATKLAEWVHDLRLRRGIGEAIKHLGDGDYAAVESDLRGMTRAAPGVRPWTGGEWWGSFDERQERRITEREDPTLAPRVATRLPTLDRALNGGLRLSKVGLVVAHTGKGKSATVNNFAFASAAGGHLTAYVSTEMNKELIDTRFDARCFGFPASDFELARFGVADLEEFDARRARLHKRLAKKLWTFSIPPKMLNLGHIHDILDEVEQETGERMVSLVVDSPDHMVPMEKLRDYRLQQAAVYWDIKQVTEERMLATWATTQGTKEYLGKLITAEGTAESYDKARIADVIVTLNQTEAEARENMLRAYIAKNRSGERGGLVYLESDWARMIVQETDPPGSSS